ncbi:Gfo/Idh/MocA family oxidoreductase [Pikeienuella sp. HZG-20]|uniref:Gfo/Idh/MocA family protein n=1 Tax=Paludibacillus litoralis TaxID=3133267 RepID=UPI0030EF5FF9
MIFGIIGCGKQAPKHIKGLRAADVKEIRVCDVDPARAQALADALGVTAVPDVPALLSSGVAAVSICTPTPSHAPLIRQCVAAGIHWMCEKPLCEDVATGEALIRETEAAGLIGAVGWIYRQVPTLRQGRTLAARQGDATSPLGAFGSAIFRIGGRGSAMPWKHYADQGGGATREMMVHMIDLAQWYFGAPKEVELLQRQLRWPERRIHGELHQVDAEDWVLASLKFEGGLDVLIQADLTSPSFTQYVELHGDNGSFVGSIQPQHASYIFLREARDQWPAGRTAMEAQPHDLYRSQMGAFVADILNGTRETADTMRGSIEVMRTMERLN